MRSALASYRVSTFAACALLVSPSSFAAEWGTITGRFVVEGDAPDQEPVNVNKDVEFCSKHTPMTQTLVVGDDGGLQNVIVYLNVGRRETVDVHPDYEDSAGEEAVLDNIGCTFEPHVLLLRTSQPLVIKNSDEVGHNTNIALLRFNQIIAAGGDTTVNAGRAMRAPSPVSCNIHPWMQGFVFVRDDPYMAVSSEDGSFTIENIPAGERSFVFWHEVPGYLDGVDYEGGSTGSSGRSRGRAALTIAPGETLDLGEIKVPVSKLR